MKARKSLKGTYLKEHLRRYASLILPLLSLVFVAVGEVASAQERVVYYHNDALGSPIAATDSAGQVVWREGYKPHGERTIKEPASSRNRTWFTGKQEEEALGLIYLGARWYHPIAGRFLIMDPAEVSPENVQSFNRYSYSYNNPYRYTDPDGRAPRPAHFKPGDGGGGGGAFYGGSNGITGRVSAGSSGGGGTIAAPAPPRTYQTYTKTNPQSGEVYTGRTSGYGSPLQNVARRDSGHHMNEKGFGPAQLDKSSTNSGAIRGREQQMIDKFGGAKSTGGTSGNKINAISPQNARGAQYRDAAKKEFGD